MARLHRNSKNLMGQPQLADKENSVLLNEIGQNTYYFSVLYLKDEIFINEAEIKEEVAEVKTQFLGSKCRPFRIIAMPKSINHQ